jgi:hypothetical protein
MVGYYTPYLFISKFASTERGVPEGRAVYLISIIGKSNDFIHLKIFSSSQVLVIQLLDLHLVG